MDLDYWKSIVDVFAPAIQAVAVVVTGVVAIQGINAWRRQQVGKRRFEVAEQALTAIYEIQNVLTWVRSGMSYQGEATFGEPTPEGEERGKIERRQDTYYVPIQRLFDRQEDFAKLHTLEHLCAIHFGEEARRPFQMIREVQTSVSVSARMLIETIRDDFDERPPREDRRGWTSDIWGGMIEDNDLTIKTKDAVAKIEQICNQHLQG